MSLAASLGGIFIVLDVTALSLPLYKLSPALAGTRRGLPSWRKESSARVYARYICSEILCGSKDKKFLGHFWLGIFIQDNLPVNLKQEV